MKTKSFLLILFLLTSPFLIKANHIFGGYMTYTYQGNESFEIEMRLFRDCNSQGAQFDNPATFSVYRGEMAPYSLMGTFEVNPEGPFTTLLSEQDDCTIEPFPFCIEEAVYKLSVSLPNTSETYHVVYQRCCRALFSGIVNSDEVGITLTAEIRPQVYQTENNSPVLSNSNFFEVCNGEEFNFSIAAQDENADSLIYELCTPIIGGGTTGTPGNPGDPNSCNGVLPTPPCSPPFLPISYILPNFSVLSPLGISSPFDLDRYTGELSGVPSIIGQFLAGVCVKEYINGEVISESRQNLVFRVDFALDVPELKPTALTFYPNPADDNVYIKLPDSYSSYDLNLRDSNGKTVRLIEKVNGMNYELDVSDLKGIYFIELKSTGKHYLGKLIVF